MRGFFVAIILMIASFSLDAQVFYSESFESLTGWSLSHTFDDGVNDFVKRDSLTNTAFDGISYPILGGDGEFAIGAENTLTSEPGSPIDGIVFLSIDPVNISGMNNLELVVSISCNADDGNFDDREADNGDFLDFEVNIDNSGWQSIGEFNSTDTLSGDSELFFDTNMNGNGGEIGDIPVTGNFKDFVMTIPGAGSSIEVRAVFKLSAETEEILLDNFRLKESEGDVMPLEVFDAYRTGVNTIDIVFQEDVGSNATNTFFYTGISNLASAVVQADGNTVTLNYGTDFVLGNGYTLVVFSIQDVAGNPMVAPYQYNFFYNDSEPELVITELMYNDASSVDSLEFVEIYNNGSTEAVLGGLELEDGISFIFPTSTLAPGEFVLVANNALAAQTYYGMPFLEYSGSLANNGELIELVNAEGATIDSVDFNNDLPWPPGADGLGPSAELNDPDNDNALGANWVASTNGLLPLDNGSPVLATPGALPGIIIPEVQFFENTIEANEIDGTVSVEISISGSNANPSIVSFTPLTGTASSPGDIGASSIPDMSFNPFSTMSQTLTIPVVNDTESEGLEYFRIEVETVNNANIGLKDTLLILIADDDFVSPPLLINELQASNTSTISDEEMEFDDWFEIYNPNAFPVDVAGYYVSDNPLNLKKDRFRIEEPETIIPANGWLLCWADEDGNQGPLHMNFRLSGEGEFLALTSQDGINVLDSLTFPAIADNFSYGRQGDGNPNFIFFGEAATTPGESNLLTSVDELAPKEFSIFPNPSEGLFFINARNHTGFSYRIYDSSMRLMKEGFSNVPNLNFDLGNSSNGMYFLVLENEIHRLIKH